MDYVEKAERVIKKLYLENDINAKGRARNNKITTSQIRGLLAGMSDIYNDVVQLDGNLTPDIISRIQYLKVQFIYESGRDSKVKGFIESAGLIKEIDEIGNSKQRFIDAERYMEALVAYHRFYGGKDE